MNQTSGLNMRGRRHPTQREFVVKQISLSTGEWLPTLVRNSNWIPLTVPTRWAVTQRRFECMENTLSNDLRGIALLYQIAQREFNLDLDESLQRCEIPPGRELDRLAACIRDENNLTGGPPRSLSTIATYLCPIKCFLRWAANPANQGLRIRKPATKIAADIERIELVFRPFAGTAVAGNRIRPVTSEELTRIWSIFGPVRDAQGQILLPIRFSSGNPFRPASMLRNWIMMSLAKQDGLRRGEILKSRTDDLPKIAGEGITILRRPHDRVDTRKYKPRVKTAERVLPVSDELRMGLMAYLNGNSISTRPRCKTPYVFVTGHGSPLSISAADAIVKVVARHADVDKLSWHSFRHAWAEEIADDLLSRGHDEDYATQLLRDLGGWKAESDTPSHYIRNALKKRAYLFLEERNRQLYGSRNSDESTQTIEDQLLHTRTSIGRYEQG